LNPSNDEHPIFLFYLASYVRRQLAIACIDFARFQRAPEGSHHSTSDTGNYVIDRRSVGFLDALGRHLVVFRDRSMDAENDRFLLAWKVRDTKWTHFPFNPDIRNVNDFGHRCLLEP
jgi:hypothetical protein